VAWVESNASVLIRDGDYDFDGDVDASDHATWKNQFGSTSWPIDGDFADGTRNGVVDAADYVVWRQNVGSGAASTFSTASLPEPSSFWLLGLAVCLLQCVFRRLFEV
jgi:hypothetical protein